MRVLFAAWDDCDRVLSGLTVEALTRSVGGGSSFAWTLGHLTNSVDFWINVRFQGRSPHPVIGHTDFRYGGSGAAQDWEAIQAAAQEVRAVARDYLESLDEQDLELVIPYDGSFVVLRATGLCLHDALDVIINHHYFQIGEIAAKRGMLRHETGDYLRPYWDVR